MRGVEGKEKRQREFKPASALYDQKGMKDLDETTMRRYVDGSSFLEVAGSVVRKEFVDMNGK